MRPKRGTTRTAQLHPQPMQSDYDTDTAANVTDAALSILPPPPQRTNTELNLTVLRRYNPAIEHILCIAPFAVVYTFSAETQAWEKCGMEGTLFVCQLAGHPAQYAVVMLNRKSLENFMTELVSADDLDITEEFVILQAMGEEGTLQVFGLWIFSDGDMEPSTREIVAKTMQNCALQAQISREAAEVEEDITEEEQDYAKEEMEEGQPQELVPENGGQKIDLLHLFGSTPAQGDGSTQPSLAPSFTQPARFTPTADTDFFRSSASPAIQPQQRVPPPAVTQQNTLLNLLKR